MPIHRDGQFLVWPDSVCGTPMLGIETGLRDECVAEFRRGPWDGVFMSRGFGFTDTDLAVLSELPGLKNIWCWDVDLQSLDGLYDHPDLEYLGLHGKRPPLDFTRFRELQTVSTDWRGRDRGLATQTQIQKFFLWHHKPRTKSVRDLKLPPTCREEAQFNWTNATTLEGLEGLRGVRSFAIHRSRNLESLRGLEHLADSLERLIVTTCGRLTDLGVLDQLPRLNLAIINGNRLRG